MPKPRNRNSALFSLYFPHGTGDEAFYFGSGMAYETELIRTQQITKEMQGISQCIDLALIDLECYLSGECIEIDGNLSKYRPQLLF